MSGWSAFWLHLYFSFFSLLLLSLCLCQHTTVGSSEGKIRSVFHSFATPRLVFGPWEWGLVLVIFFAKDGFFFTGVLVFWF